MAAGEYANARPPQARIEKARQQLVPQDSNDGQCRTRSYSRHGGSINSVRRDAAEALLRGDVFFSRQLIR
eukprot:scaffold44910_cov20-Prasinocladus_malaysianus.AAC.2